MALLVAVACALVAVANAGMMMNMMQPQMQQGMVMVPMGNGGCNQDSNGNMPEGCQIPMQTMDNIEQYLEEQMRQQQYETQAMSERIHAQFEQMVRNVTMKKHRHVMSIVTEFVSFCSCAGTSSQLYDALFVQQARVLNLTDIVEVYNANRQPYEAVNEEDARGLIFGGLVRVMCESVGNFMTFADQVSQRVTAIRAATVQGK